MFNYTITNYGINKYKSKWILTFGVVTNISLLGYFKYTNFFVDRFNEIFGVSISVAHIVLPLAISFYTFQQIAWLVDNYKKEAPESNFIEYACAVLFFPHLIAGPIVQYHDLVPQLKELKSSVNYKLILNGFFLIAIGCVKKVYIADYLSMFVDTWYSSYTDFNTIKAWLATFGYASQIYFDFSGYCDIAIGSALIFGIKLPQNFNDPYKATSIRDFWRRWHITLGYFLTKYVYIPLGGNRKGYRRTLINIFLMLCISGLWHGAGVTFILWGALHGAAMVIHRVFSDSKLSIVKPLSIFITFITVCLLWVMFRSDSVECASYVYKNLFSLNIPHGVNWEIKSGFDLHDLRKYLYVLILSFIVVFLFPKAQDIFDKHCEKYSIVISVFSVIAICLALFRIIVNSYTTFIYFNF
ncbi:MBOAT family O-acyltransferase [Succinivibrio dextrinosolvens]|uniref:MBOAT family O-acyltransferase n=1 Tax=Succinivibrio dextrinosolvens TaxID=83771 RepID=UPI0015A70DC5|nr:MBOAT family O-acyltransferase [Succinivibrio dextrinosolvens]